MIRRILHHTGGDEIINAYESYTTQLTFSVLEFGYFNVFVV